MQHAGGKAAHLQAQGGREWAVGSGQSYRPIRLCDRADPDISGVEVRDFACPKPRIVAAYVLQ